MGKELRLTIKMDSEAFRPDDEFKNDPTCVENSMSWETESVLGRLAESIGAFGWEKYATEQPLLDSNGAVTGTVQIHETPVLDPDGKLARLVTVKVSADSATARRICWPDPDVTCLQGGCGYCNYSKFRSLVTIRKYAENATYLMDAYSDGFEHDFFNAETR